ncbi:MAG: hypothetical protein JXN65_11830 [Clostridia bacterium]|nr:hypothetical protein [Clostridia bacterium]
MKKVILVMLAITVSFILCGCNVGLYNDLVNGYILQIECTNEEVYDFLKSDENLSAKELKAELETILPETCSEFNISPDQVEVSRVVKRVGGYLIVLDIDVSEDIDAAFNQGIAIGQADEMLEKYFNLYYNSDDLDENYEKLKLEADEGKITIVNARSRILTEKRLEKILKMTRSVISTSSDYSAIFLDTEMINFFSLPGAEMIVIAPEVQSDEFVYDGTAGGFMDKLFGKKSTEIQITSSKTTFENAGKVLIIRRNSGSLVKRNLYIFIGLVALVIIISLVVLFKKVFKH